MGIKVGKTYRLRNGHVATIHKTDGYGSFPIKGSTTNPKKPRSQPTYCIWTPAGRFYAVSSWNSQWDILEEVE